MDKSNFFKRRTFGIISHPDAGKTTLTEKLLLYGGAINEAGAVKSNKIKKTAVSDFMEIEKQRGISVSTSVLAFTYKDKKINILDTPGHKDFAEDTYRTISAVDSVIVVIDISKGVEIQTEKLVEVCKMRKIPIIVFINKLDREGKDPFDVLDETESKLKLKISPFTYPIGIGQDFKGIYDFKEKKIKIFENYNKLKLSDPTYSYSINDKKAIKNLGNKIIKNLSDEINLLTTVYPKFNLKSYLKGDLNPVFFGSALNNFGVKELLNVFTKIAPEPQKKEAIERVVLPNEEIFSGFIFKIHANIDPNHRDRIAFVKIVSGKFIRNKSYLHVRLNKFFKFSRPNTFFAEKKKIVEVSLPGDIVGLHDTGNFKIGDSLTSGEKLNFKGILSFSPENFKYINNEDPFKSKQLNKGISQLMDEGVAQLFILNIDNRKVIGTVGALQFEVIKYRLENEYGAKCSYEDLKIFKALWIDDKNSEKNELNEFKKLKNKFLAKDKENKSVYLAESNFSIQIIKEKFPKIKLQEKSEFD